MTFKCSVVGVPMGAARSSQMRSHKMSQSEIELVARGYIRALAISLVLKDIPAPDINTNPQVMA